jgi:hypothetical protein
MKCLIWNLDAEGIVLNAISLESGAKEVGVSGIIDRFAISAIVSFEMNLLPSLRASFKPC